jgi:hypothetical protein
VIYVLYDEPKSIFVITAFDLIGKPLIAYKRRSQKEEKLTVMEIPLQWVS